MGHIEKMDLKAISNYWMANILHATTTAKMTGLKAKSVVTMIDKLIGLPGTSSTMRFFRLVPSELSWSTFCCNDRHEDKDGHVFAESQNHNKETLDTILGAVMIRI
jgi:hypothetical protein